MYESIAILGRQPKLGIAELESLFGADSVKPYGNVACFIDKASSDISFYRLGGSVRLCKVLAKVPNDWRSIESYLIETSPKHAESINGKLIFGLSIFGIKVPAKKIARTALEIKKSIRASGKSVRMVPHNEVALGSATVLYNKLTSKNGWELCVISDGKETYLAQTVAIQDIDAYAARDQKRPYRDAKVGMLPPKLAQIIINLAVGKLPEKEIRARLPGKSSAQASSTTNRIDNTLSEQRISQAGLDGKANYSNQAVPDSEICDRVRVLDPFCGTGVLLQEAMLMDYDIVGTDIEPRMIEFSIKNLQWLDEKYPDVGDYRRIEIGDATTHKWHQPEKITAVAAETYLGRPLGSLPPSDQLRKIMHEANEINHKFLINISPQLKKGTRLCLGVPTWRGKHEFLHLPMLDHLTEMGYNRLKFKHVDNEDIIYHREGQVVGRELLVLEKQ